MPTRAQLRCSLEADDEPREPSLGPPLARRRDNEVLPTQDTRRPLGLVGARHSRKRRPSRGDLRACRPAQARARLVCRSDPRRIVDQVQPALLGFAPSQSRRQRLVTSCWRPGVASHGVAPQALLLLATLRHWIATRPQPRSRPTTARLCERDCAFEPSMTPARLRTLPSVPTYPASRNRLAVSECNNLKEDLVTCGKPRKIEDAL